MIMDKKELYQSPTTDVFTVQTEGVICQSGQDTLGINDWSTDGGISFDF